MPSKPVSTVLVTGATGFIGSNIVAHLAEHGHRVVAVDLARPPGIVETYWHPVYHKIVFEAGSVTDFPRMQDIVRRRRPTAIVHAAAVTALDEAEAAQAARMFEVNVMGTVNLLEAARHPSVRRMIYIGASGVYGPGDPQQSLPETAPQMTEGRELYTQTKAVCERLCTRYEHLFGKEVIVGRLGGPYGPMERDTGVRAGLSEIYQLARAALTLKTVRLRFAEHCYDWTYTRDHAEAIRRLIEADNLPHRAYNLSSGRQRCLSDVLVCLEALIPGARFLPVGAGEPADLDVSDSYTRGPLEVERLRCDVGFEPQYDLEQGLLAALPWWEEMVRHERLAEEIS